MFFINFLFPFFLFPLFKASLPPTKFPHLGENIHALRGNGEGEGNISALKSFFYVLDFNLNPSPLHFVPDPFNPLLILQVHLLNLFRSLFFRFCLGRGGLCTTAASFFSPLLLPMFSQKKLPDDSFGHILLSEVI